MKITIDNASQFRDAFHRAGRGTQFSYEALGMLFDYFEELDEELGEDTELDVIAICCEYCEMSEDEFRQSYDCEGEIEDAIRDNTPFIGKTNRDTYIFAQF